MHRPSKEILESNLKMTGIINSYGKTYFNEFKYLSDSRRRWREPVEEIVASEQYDKLHILTHAFWYNETEKSLHDSLLDFIKLANMERYLTQKDNLTDLESVVAKEEIPC